MGQGDKAFRRDGGIAHTAGLLLESSTGVC